MRAFIWLMAIVFNGILANYIANELYMKSIAVSCAAISFCVYIHVFTKLYPEKKEGGK